MLCSEEPLASASVSATRPSTVARHAVTSAGSAGTALDPSTGEHRVEAVQDGDELGLEVPGVVDRGDEVLGVARLLGRFQLRDARRVDGEALLVRC